MAEKCRISIPPPAHNRRDLIDVPVYSTGEYAVLVADFKRRLEAMVSYAERVGAIPVLILPPANDSNYEPNRSFLPAATPRDQREAFRQAFLAASRMEEQDPAASMARYRELIERQPGFAESHYRLARLLDRADSHEEAYLHYVAARDLDGYPLRCPTAFQEAYREVASRHRCLLIDGQAYLRKIGRRGQLGDDLFQDMMHPSLRGYIALSQAVLQGLKERQAFGWPRDLPCPAIDPALCADRFGLGAETWKHLCSWQKGFNEIVVPLRYDRSQRLRRQSAAKAAAERLSRGTPPEELGMPNVGIPDPIPMVRYSAFESVDIGESSEP